jgi:hypothetical protein
MLSRNARHPDGADESPAWRGKRNSCPRRPEGLCRPLRSLLVSPGRRCISAAYEPLHLLAETAKAGRSSKRRYRSRPLSPSRGGVRSSIDNRTLRRWSATSCRSCRELADASHGPTLCERRVRDAPRLLLVDRCGSEAPTIRGAQFGETEGPVSTAQPRLSPITLWRWLCSGVFAALRLIGQLDFMRSALRGRSA